MQDKLADISTALKYINRSYDYAKWSLKMISKYNRRKHDKHQNNEIYAWKQEIKILILKQEQLIKDMASFCKRNRPNRGNKYEVD